MKDKKRAKKLQTKHPSIYIVSNPAFPGMYKTGITFWMEGRISQYQTGDPLRRYKVEYCVETPLARLIEAYICREYKANYEWIQGNLEEIIQDINHQINI